MYAAGPILIAVNPFKRLPLYTEETLLTYFEHVSHRHRSCLMHLIELLMY